MKISKISETAIYCDDVEEMLNFYQNLFAFPVIENSLPRAVFLQCGSNILAIFNRAMTAMPDQLPPAHGSTGPQHFALEISSDEEYDAWKARFLEKGVPIEQEIEWASRDNGAKSFFFRDPADNNVEIAMRKLWDAESVQY